MKSNCWINLLKGQLQVFGFDPVTDSERREIADQLKAKWQAATLDNVSLTDTTDGVMREKSLLQTLARQAFDLTENARHTCGPGARAWSHEADSIEVVFP